MAQGLLWPVCILGTSSPTITPCCPCPHPVHSWIGVQQGAERGREVEGDHSTGMLWKLLEIEIISSHESAVPLGLSEGGPLARPAIGSSQVPERPLVQAGVFGGVGLSEQGLPLEERTEQPQPRFQGQAFSSGIKIGGLWAK